MATANVDVSKLSYNDLCKLIEEAQSARNAKKDEEIKVLADGFIKKCQAAGFTVEEAIAACRPYLPPEPVRRGAGPRRPSKGPAKYVDPANPLNTYGGKGKRPAWLANYLAEGRQLEEFLAKVG